MTVTLLETSYSRVKMGYFTCDKPSIVNATKHKVVAYDRMAKLDRDVSAFIDGLSYPLTIKSLQTQLCSLCGVPFDGVTFVNDSYSVKQNFTGENITGRQVQQWIAEAAGGFAMIDRQGQLGIRKYTSSGMTLTTSSHTKAELSDYQITKIGQVTVRVSEEDVGVAVPATGGTNPYVIQNNPLLYATTDAQLRPSVTNIYNAVRNIVYTPGSVTDFADPSVDAGSYVSVKSGSSTLTILVMSAVWKGNTVTYSSYGERDFSNVAPANIQITALNRKTNVLVRTLDETRSELADAQGQISTISQTVNKIELTVSNQAGQISTISQTVSGIQTTVSNQAGQISTINQTVSGIQTTVENQAGDISTLEQTATGLTATVSGLKSAQDATKLTFDSSGLTIKNGGFKIINSSNTTTFSVNGTTGALSLTGSITTASDSNGRYFSLTSSGLTFFSNGTNVGNLYIENPSLGNRSVASLDYFTVRNAGSSSVTAGRLFYDSSIATSRLEVGVASFDQVAAISSTTGSRVMYQVGWLGVTLAGGQQIIVLAAR